MQILKKIGKVFLYILLGIVVLLFIVGLFLDPIAKKVLEDQVANVDEGQYSLSLDEVDVSILGGTFRMHGMVFETDTAHFETPPIAFITADEVAVEGVSWLRYLLSDKLSMDEVRLDNLNLALYARQQLDEEEEQQEEDPSPFRIRDLDIYPTIRDQVDRFHLKDLTFNELSVTLANVTTQDTLSFNAGAFHIDSDDIVVDANKLITENRAFYATYINFEGEEIEVRVTGNQLMRVETDFFRFATREQMMNILVQGMDYLDSDLQKNDTLMYVALQDFSLVNLNMERLQSERTGHIENISLNELNVVSNMPVEESADTAQTQEEQQPINLAELSLGENMPEVMDRLELDQLDIRKVNVRQTGLLSLHDFNLNVQKIIVDEQPAFANNRFMHATIIESDFEELAMGIEEPAQQISLQGFAMNVDEGIGDIGFRELKVMPTERSDDEMWVDAEIGPFNLIRLDTRDLTNKQLAIDSIGIGSPNLLVNMPPADGQPEEESEFEVSDLDLYPAISDVLNSFSLRKFAITGADIEVQGVEGFEDGVRIPAFYLQIRDILIAEGTAFAGNRIMHTEDIAMRVEDLEVSMPDNLHTFKLDLARMSTYEQFFELGALSYDYGDKARQILEGDETNQLLKASNERLRINNLNYQRMLLEQGVFIGSIKAEGFDFYTYQDENYPAQNGQGGEEAQQEQQAGEGTGMPTEMPQEILRQLDMPVYLGSLELNQGNIVYELKIEDADTAGVMEISNLNVNVSNVTNLEERLRENREMSLQVDATIMGDGRFETAMVFDMLSDTNDVRLTGTVDSLDLTTLNEFTTYTSRLALRSGQLHKLSWDINADQQQANGEMEMMYEDLNMRISGGSGPDTTGIFKDIGAFLANTLVLERDVPTEDPEEPEVVEVEKEKEEDQTFVDLYVSTLVDGLLDLMLTISFLL